jgi:hypothetical protein
MLLRGSASKTAVRGCGRRGSSRLGIGVNTHILRVMQEADPDVCLLASQYSLISHKACSLSRSTG